LGLVYADRGSAGKQWLDSYSSGFHPLYMDGSRVLVHSKKSLVQGCDFGILGSTPVLFSKIPSDRLCLNFIDVTQQLRDRTVRIEDSVTGKEVFQLCGKYANPSVI